MRPVIKNSYHIRKQAYILSIALLKTPPKALTGDRVSVHNYRSKGPAPRWEDGEVIGFKTSFRIDEETGEVTVSNSYDVLLDRRRTGRKAGNALILYVNDNGINLIEPKINFDKVTKPNE